MITPLFADSTPNANTVWIVILAISALGGNLATIGIWAATRRKQETMISPQPLVIEMQKEFVSKPEFHALVTNNDQTHRDIFSKIGGVERGANGNADKKIEDLRHERREDMRSLHSEINEVSKKVAGLEKETELQNQRMASMDSKLDRLIERS